VPEELAPGVYVEETSYRSKAIEGVSTSTGRLGGAVRCGLDATAQRAAVLLIGALLGVVAAIAVDEARRRRRRVPPTP
jgi:phage tail sheath protein FI